jgi:hypothetical protein
LFKEESSFLSGTKHGRTRREKERDGWAQSKCRTTYRHVEPHHKESTNSSTDTHTDRGSLRVIAFQSSKVPHPFGKRAQRERICWSSVAKRSRKKEKFEFSEDFDRAVAERGEKEIVTVC